MRDTTEIHLTRPNIGLCCSEGISGQKTPSLPFIFSFSFVYERLTTITAVLFMSKSSPLQTSCNKHVINASVQKITSQIQKKSRNLAEKSQSSSNTLFNNRTADKYSENFFSPKYVQYIARIVG